MARSVRCIDTKAAPRRRPYRERLAAEPTNTASNERLACPPEDAFPKQCTEYDSVMEKQPERGGARAENNAPKTIA